MRSQGQAHQVNHGTIALYRLYVTIQYRLYIYIILYLYNYIILINIMLFIEELYIPLAYHSIFWIGSASPLNRILGPDAKKQDFEFALFVMITAC